MRSRHRGGTTKGDRVSHQLSCCMIESWSLYEQLCFSNSLMAASSEWAERMEQRTSSRGRLSKRRKGGSNSWGEEEERTSMRCWDRSTREHSMTKVDKEQMEEEQQMRHWTADEAEEQELKQSMEQAQTRTERLWGLTDVDAMSGRAAAAVCTRDDKQQKEQKEEEEEKHTTDQKSRTAAEADTPVDKQKQRVDRGKGSSEQATAAHSQAEGLTEDRCT
jgi:hypothetical protein